MIIRMNFNNLWALSSQDISKKEIYQSDCPQCTSKSSTKGMQTIQILPINRILTFKIPPLQTTLQINAHHDWIISKIIAMWKTRNKIKPKRVQTTMKRIWAQEFQRSNRQPVMIKCISIIKISNQVCLPTKIFRLWFQQGNRMTRRTTTSRSRTHSLQR